MKSSPAFHFTSMLSIVNTFTILLVILAFLFDTFTSTFATSAAAMLMMMMKFYAIHLPFDIQRMITSELFHFDFLHIHIITIISSTFVFLLIPNSHTHDESL
jgi:hypothetical protein